MTLNKNETTAKILWAAMVLLAGVVLTIGGITSSHDRQLARHNAQIEAMDRRMTEHQHVIEAALCRIEEVQKEQNRKLEQALRNR